MRTGRSVSHFAVCQVHRITGTRTAFDFDMNFVAVLGRRDVPWTLKANVLDVVTVGCPGGHNGVDSVHLYGLLALRIREASLVDLSSLSSRHSRRRLCATWLTLTEILRWRQLVKA